MTLEKLLGITAAEWESISDEQLETILSPYFKVTRPTKKVVRGDKPVSMKVNPTKDVRKLMQDVQQLMKLAEKK